MEPVRPKSVSAEATCIPPSITQASTIATIEASNTHDNANQVDIWASGMKDWATNAQIDHNLGKPVQSHPPKPDIYRTQVTYADIYGVIHPEPRAANGEFYAWVETVVT